MGKLHTILALLLAVVLSPSLLLGAPTTRTSAVIIPIDGEITDFTYQFLVRRIEKARDLGADTVVLDINTFGGQVTSAVDIGTYLRNRSDLHCIAYVRTKAISAGTMIALACNEVVAAPGSIIGDCAPIRIDPSGNLQSVPETERAKFVSPVKAEFQASAARNGYDPLLVESLYWVGTVVYAVDNADGQRRFVNEADYATLTAQGWHDAPGLPRPVNRRETLLTIHGDLAVQLGLARETSPSALALLESRHLKHIATLEEGVGALLIEVLNTTVAKIILLTIFLLCLYVSLHAPGHGVAEVLAAVALGTVLVVSFLTGYAQWWEILAVIVGLALLALEVFVIPGFGVVGITGILLVVGGFLLMFVAPEPGRSPLSLPTIPATWTSLRQGLVAVVSSLTLSMIGAAMLRRYLPRLPLFNRLILNTAVGQTDSAMAGSLTNIDPDSENPSIGAVGITTSDLRPSGYARFADAAGGPHVVAVISDSGLLHMGTRVVVTEARGNRILVKSAPNTQAPEALA